MASFVSSYIPTQASQVTRAADQVSILTSAFPYSATAGTLVFEGDRTPQSASTWFASLNDGTAVNRIILYSNAQLPQFLVTASSTNYTSSTFSAVATGAPFKFAAAWALNDGAASKDGSAVNTVNPLVVPTVTTLLLGKREASAANALTGHLKRLAYYASRKTNAELQVLST